MAKAKKEVPLLLSVLLALTAWFGQRYVDVLVESPILSYDVTIDHGAQDPIPEACADSAPMGASIISYQIVIENLSTSTAFKDVTISLDVPERTAQGPTGGGVYALRALDVAPTRSNVLGSPRCAKGSPTVLSLTVPVLQPGSSMKFDAWAPAGSRVEPFFKTSKDYAVHVMADNIQTCVLRNRGKLLGGILVLLFALAGWYFYILETPASEGQ